MNLFEIDYKNKEIIINDEPYGFSVSIEEFKKEASKILKLIS